MGEESDFALSPEACHHLEKIHNADVLVGIPSYNNVLTASFVISQIVNGLATYFPDLRAAIFVSDGNSIDGTLKSVRTVQFPCQRRDSCNLNLIPAVYVGISGKGSALKAIFEGAHFLGVKAVAVVDSDLRSITPEWMKLMISPLLSDSDFVVPLYNRRKYDGTITDFLCYPVTASLYGKDIRQPIGGDFGLSIELVERILASPMWVMPEVHEFGIDILETHSALAYGFRVTQAHLGVKDHNPKDPTKQLAPMFHQVVSTMFACIEQYEPKWREIRDISDVDTLGEEKHVNLQESIKVDLKDMLAAYANGFDTYLYSYQSILNGDILDAFRRVKNLGTESFSFPMEAWANVVYSFIAAFHKAEPSARAGLIDSLRVLWMGRLASFISETMSLSPQETEMKIREQADVFGRLKPFLSNIF